jgi:hypothetical protein
MEHATLVGFLTGTLSPEMLADEITSEVNAATRLFEREKMATASSPMARPSR